MHSRSFIHHPTQISRLGISQVHTKPGSTWWLPSTRRRCKRPGSRPWRLLIIRLPQHQTCKNKYRIKSAFEVSRSCHFHVGLGPCKTWCKRFLSSQVVQYILPMLTPLRVTRASVRSSLWIEKELPRMRIVVSDRGSLDLSHNSIETNYTVALNWITSV